MSIFSIFKGSKCSICKRKVTPLSEYRNDKGEKVKVCVPCSDYAERRAFRRLGD